MSSTLDTIVWARIHFPDMHPAPPVDRSDIQTCRTHSTTCADVICTERVVARIGGVDGMSAKCSCALAKWSLPAQSTTGHLRRLELQTNVANAPSDAPGQHIARPFRSLRRCRSLGAPGAIALQPIDFGCRRRSSTASSNPGAYRLCAHVGEHACDEPMMNSSTTIRLSIDGVILISILHTFRR